MMNMMTDARFEELAGIYGSKIAWWPEAEQADAEALLASSDAARAVLEAESALDTAMDGLEAPVPSEALMARILGDAAEVSAAQQASEPAAPRAATADKPGFLSKFFGDMGWRPAGAMTACLAIGFMAGMSGAPGPMDAEVEVASVQEDNAVITAFFGDDTDNDPFDLEIL